MANNETETKITRDATYHLVARNDDFVAIGQGKPFTVFQFRRKREMQDFIKNKNLTADDIAGVFKGRQVLFSEQRQIVLK